MKKYILKINTNEISTSAFDDSIKFSDNQDSDNEYLQVETQPLNKEQIIELLKSLGYDTENNFEIQGIIEEGGEYSGLGDVEWAVQVLDVEEKKIINEDLTIEEFIDDLKKELDNYNKDENYNNDEFENEAFDTAEGFLTEDQIRENELYNLKATNKERLENLINSLVKYKLPDSELEKSFNQSEEFVKQYRDYLIGKKINAGSNNQIEEKISEVLSKENFILIETENDRYRIFNEDFQRFIDGEEFYVNYEKQGNYKSEAKIQLILEKEKEDQKIEEKIEEKINQPDYKYYIINIENNKFLEGFEYREDANERAEELESYGQKVNVFSKKAPNIDDPNDNNNWLTDTHDWAIIEQAIQLGINKNDIDQNEANKIINKFKEGNGSYVSVVKAWLIYYLRQCQRNTLDAFTFNNIEKAKQLSEYCSRTEKELMRILSMEK